MTHPVSRPVLVLAGGLSHERDVSLRSGRRAAEALRDARVDELAVPTLAEGETLADVRAESFDTEAAARRGMAFEALDQLALEHLYGVA